MTTLEEKLEEAAKQEDRVKQVDLVNQAFTIHSARMIEFKDADGNDKQSMVAMISFDGEEPVEAWMDGVKVRPQIHVFEEEKAFPSKVKLVKDGQAYKLMLVAQLPATNGLPAQKVTLGGTKSPGQVVEELFAAVALTKTDDELLDILKNADAEMGLAFNDKGRVAFLSPNVPLKALMALKKALEA